MKLTKKTTRTYWCGRCRQSKAKELMTTKKFCCCVSCDLKSKCAIEARISETVPTKKVPVHTVEHKKAMNAMAYEKELAALDDVNGWLYD